VGRRVFSRLKWKPYYLACTTARTRKQTAVFGETGSRNMAKTAYLNLPLSTSYSLSYIHRVSKKRPTFGLLQLWRTWMDFYIFLAEMLTNNVGNQKTLYYATSNNLCFCTTWQNAETRKSHIPSVGLCYRHNALVRYLPERKNCHMWCVWQRLTFVEVVRYPITTVHWLLLQAWRRTTPMFYTVTDSVTDLANTEHMGNRQQDAMLPS